MRNILLVISFLTFNTTLQGQYYWMLWQYESGASYSTEFQAVVDEYSSNGWGSFGTTEATAGDDFCTCLVTNSLWDELDWLHVSVGVPSENGANGVNWKNPSGSVTNFTESGTITWNTNTGWTTNGSSYLNTGWAPDDGVNFTQNDASFGVYATDFTYPTSTDYLMGSRGSSDWSTIGFRSFAGQSRNYYSINSPGGSFHVEAFSGGTLFHSRRAASAAHRFSVDGTEEGFAGSTSASPNSNDFTLFAYNRLGTITGHVVSGVDIWMAFAGSSDIDDGDFNTCWQAYLTDLGL